MTMTAASLHARAHDGVVPDNDPAAKPVRRRFTAAYKLAILEEYEQTTGPGAKGALLRREGLVFETHRGIGASQAEHASSVGEAA